MPQEAVIQLYDEYHVVKILISSIQDAVERFEVEKRVYERLSPHPRVIGYHGMRSGVGYARGILLDVAINGSITDYLTEHPNTPRNIRNRWCLEITEGLMHLQNKKVIWSDGNPANVLLDAGLNALLSDFGGSSIDGSIATAFAPMGYSRFESPWAPPSFHTDIYSLGSILFYILSGSHPYVLDENAVTSALPTIPTTVGPAFREIIQKCWNGNYQTSNELLDDVRAATDACNSERVVGRPPRLSYQFLAFAPDDQRPHTLSVAQFWYTFRWGDITAKDVFVHIVATDDRSTIVLSTNAQLERTWSSFEVTVSLPWSAEVRYKFHVDGRWLALAALGKEVDEFGHDNNLYWTPHKTHDSHHPFQSVPQPT